MHFKTANGTHLVLSLQFKECPVCGKTIADGKRYTYCSRKCAFEAIKGGAK